MNTVELIYDTDCPNVKAAREQLLRAFTEMGFSPRWSEWDRSDPAGPAYVRTYGSPTILVDGKDIAGAEPAHDISCCRLYVDATGGFKGVPPVELIVSALQSVNKRSVSGNRAGRMNGWRNSLATLPGIGAALLPAGVCPACWPVYAGLLSSLGLGFLLNTAYLFPLTILFLFIAVASLGFRAGTRRGYGPFAVGVLGSIILVIGKFAFYSDPAMYGGIVLLIGASFWNSWPKKIDNSCSCAACVPAGYNSRRRQVRPPAAAAVGAASCGDPVGIYSKIVRLGRGRMPLLQLTRQINFEIPER